MCYLYSLCHIIGTYLTVEILFIYGHYHPQTDCVITSLVIAHYFIKNQY